MIPELHVASQGALAEWDRQVSLMVQDTIDETCLPLPLLNVLASVLTGDTPAEERSEFRFFAMALLGAAGGDPLDAVAVSAISRLWWAGAEALDDLVDGGVIEPPWTPERLLLVGTTCLAVLPLTVIHRAPVTHQVRDYWLRAITRSSLDAAEGQLQDLDHVTRSITWKNVMSTYVRKTGAAYGAEATMAARIATGEEKDLEIWHTFGQILGVLRQLHNDNAYTCAEHDGDLTNGTPTLLLAHAIDSSDDPAQFLELRGAAQKELAARTALRALLHRPDVFAGYRQRVLNLHGCALQLLTSLTEPSKYQHMLRIMLDVSAAWAIRDLEASA